MTGLCTLLRGGGQVSACQWIHELLVDFSTEAFQGPNILTQPIPTDVFHLRLSVGVMPQHIGLVCEPVAGVKHQSSLCQDAPPRQIPAFLSRSPNIIVYLPSRQTRDTFFAWHWPKKLLPRHQLELQSLTLKVHNTAVGKWTQSKAKIGRWDSYVLNRLRVKVTKREHSFHKYETWIESVFGCLIGGGYHHLIIYRY